MAPDHDWEGLCGFRGHFDGVARRHGAARKRGSLPQLCDRDPFGSIWRIDAREANPWGGPFSVSRQSRRYQGLARSRRIQEEFCATIKTAPGDETGLEPSLHACVLAAGLAPVPATWKNQLTVSLDKSLLHVYVRSLCQRSMFGMKQLSLALCVSSGRDRELDPAVVTAGGAALLLPLSVSHDKSHS